MRWIILALLAGCTGPPLNYACKKTYVATIEHCSNQPVPSALFADGVPADLTVYFDGSPLPASAWQVGQNGHTIVILQCPTAVPEHLVSVSVGCVAE